MQNEISNTPNQEKPTFPTPVDADGYFFYEETDKELGIRTKVFENGNTTKTVSLSDGKMAVIRELTGRDMKAISRYQGQDQERYMLSAIAVATTIDGKPETFEYFEGMKLKSLNRLMAMFQSINF